MAPATISFRKKIFVTVHKDADKKYDRFVITKNGKDKAVILSSDEFEGLMETLDILSRKEEKEAICQKSNFSRKSQRKENP